MAMAKEAEAIVYLLEGDFGLVEESVRRMSRWTAKEASALTSGRPRRLSRA